MKILSKNQFENLIEEFPDGGIVFAEYTPDILNSELMVTDGKFGARQVIPYPGEVFDFDSNIKEYKDHQLFLVFDNDDILKIIPIFTC